MSALHQLFYTEAWPHGPSASALLGDPTMGAQERRAHLRASDGHDAWDELPRIEAPTLVLHGRADLMVPSGSAELIASQIPDATVRLPPLGRHGFFEEFADELQPAGQPLPAGARPVSG